MHHKYASQLWGLDLFSLAIQLSCLNFLSSFFFSLIIILLFFRQLLTSVGEKIKINKKIKRKVKIKTEIWLLKREES